MCPLPTNMFLVKSRNRCEHVCMYCMYVVGIISWLLTVGQRAVILPIVLMSILFEYLPSRVSLSLCRFSLWSCHDVIILRRQDSLRFHTSPNLLAKFWTMFYTCVCVWYVLYACLLYTSRCV